MNCAIINNNIVEQVREVSQEEFDQGIANRNQFVLSLDGILPLPQSGWLFNGKDFSSPTMSSKISKLALRQRFTFTELVTIKTASASNAMVGVLLDNLSVATYIDLSLPTLQQGIGLLVQLGLLTQDRATIILTTPATHSEIYKGNE
jgi:hypothetical protein